MKTRVSGAKYPLQLINFQDQGEQESSSLSATITGRSKRRVLRVTFYQALIKRPLVGRLGLTTALLSQSAGTGR